MIKNNYFKQGNQIFIFIDSEKHGCKAVIIDAEDIDKINEWDGVCIQATNRYKEGQNPSLYPLLYRYDKAEKRSYHKKLHLALGIQRPKGYVIDHIDNNTFNDAKANFQVITNAENIRKMHHYKKLVNV